MDWGHRFMLGHRRLFVIMADELIRSFAGIEIALDWERNDPFLSCRRTSRCFVGISIDAGQVRHENSSFGIDLAPGTRVYLVVDGVTG